MVSLIFRDKSGVSDVALVKGFPSPPPPPAPATGGQGRERGAEESAETCRNVARKLALV